MTTTRSDPVAAAIDEDPEEVARLIRRLGLVNELLDTVDLGRAALDDEMVASLSESGSLLAETADGMATRETVGLAESVGTNAGELEDALERLVQLEQSGTLEDLIELADAASLMTAALDDEMVASLARTGGSAAELLDTAADQDTARGLESTLDAVGEAAAEDPEPVGTLGLLKAFRDPDIQRGLGFVLAVASGIGEGVERDVSHRDEIE